MPALIFLSQQSPLIWLVCGQSSDHRRSLPRCGKVDKDIQCSYTCLSCCVYCMCVVQMTFQLFLMVALYFVPIILMGAAYTRIAMCLWSSTIPSETVSTSGTVMISSF